MSHKRSTSENRFLVYFLETIDHHKCLKYQRQNIVNHLAHLNSAGLYLAREKLRFEEK